MPDHTPRVLQLLPALGDGGVERSTVEMAAYLTGLDLENFIASAGGPLADKAIGLGARHMKIEVGRKSPTAMIAAAYAVARLVDRNEIDIIHARSRAPAWVGLMAKTLARRPVRFLTTFHGVYSHGNAAKRLYNSAMLRAPVVVANSQFIRDHITSVYGYPSERIVLAPRGVDPAIFDPEAISDRERATVRAELGAAPQTPLIVMASRITGWKGHAVFVEALAMLARTDVRAAFVGSGAENAIAALKHQLHTLGLEDRVVFTGSRRDIPAVLAAADLAVSASIRPEAFGRASIEAQAMETPVIATDHGGSRETVTDSETGWLVAPGSSLALATAIDDAFSDRVRLSGMGRAGRRNVIERFTTQAMLEAEFSAYRRVMTERA